MIVLLWTLIFGFHSYVFCYENLSRRTTTVLSQSSTFDDKTASFANDGSLTTDFPTCAHTAPNHTKAWLQVDFGQPFRINNVKIYPRREFQDGYFWYQYRFRQFYLDVSNSSASETTTSGRTRCYTDITTAPDLPSNITDVPCEHTARYVIVETTYDAPEDDPTTGAVLEICEIEVYGCFTTCKYCDDFGFCTWCPDGYWGSACDFGCPAHCKESKCDILTGNCINCKPGYLGDTCNSQCENNTDKYTILKDSNSEILFTLYAVIAALFISFIFNGYMIRVILRQNKSQGQDVKQERMSCNSPHQDCILTENVYDTAEDNYQELNQLSEPSRYDQLQGPKTDSQ